MMYSAASMDLLCAECFSLKGTLTFSAYSSKIQLSSGSCFVSFAPHFIKLNLLEICTPLILSIDAKLIGVCHPTAFLKIKDLCVCSDCFLLFDALRTGSLHSNYLLTLSIWSVVAVDVSFNFAAKFQSSSHLKVTL